MIYAQLSKGKRKKPITIARGPSSEVRKLCARGWNAFKPYPKKKCEDSDFIYILDHNHVSLYSPKKALTRVFLGRFKRDQIEAMEWAEQRWLYEDFINNAEIHLDEFDHLLVFSPHDPQPKEKALMEKAGFIWQKDYWILEYESLEQAAESLKQAGFDPKITKEFCGL